MSASTAKNFKWFNEEQKRAVIDHRIAFNESQRDLGRRQRSSRTMIGNAAPIPRQVWGIWDRRAIRIRRDILSVFSNLASSVSMPIPIGKSMYHFMRVSDSGEVHTTMDGRSIAKTDQPVMDYIGAPIPIHNTTYSFGWRQIEAARTEGFQLDPVARDNAIRVIAEKLEDSTINGDSNVVLDGVQQYGLTNHPKRATRSTGVTLRSATGKQWRQEIMALLKTLHAKNFRTGVTLYMNWDDVFYASNTDDTDSYASKTILMRVRELDYINEIVPGSKVPANTIIAVVKDQSVISVMNSMPLTTIPRFRANIHDDYDFVTMAAAALLIRYDMKDQCGIAVSS